MFNMDKNWAKVETEMEMQMEEIPYSFLNQVYLASCWLEDVHGLILFVPLAVICFFNN